MSEIMALQHHYQLSRAFSISASLSSSSSSSSSSSYSAQTHFHVSFFNEKCSAKLSNLCLHCCRCKNRRKTRLFVGKEDLQLPVQDEEEEAPPPTSQDLECIQEIKRVLDLLRKNRDMIFNEVKLTIMIEDPREVERRRLLGIEDPDAPTRDDLVEALEQVNEGKVPNNRTALRMLAEEMMSWPNLEVEAPKTKPSKSLYAKATDTGVNPKEAAKRLNIGWDSAAEIEEADTSDDTEVPPAMGYGALYLVTAFPVIIGISVVLILFYNSLQ